MLARYPLILSLILLQCIHIEALTIMSSLKNVRVEIFFRTTNELQRNTNDASNLMSAICNNAEDGSAGGENEMPARTITLYRSGFTVDNFK